MNGGPAELALCRSGGLAGLPMRAALNTSDLDPEQAHEIETALDRVDLDRLAGQPPGGRALPDAFQYRLEISRANATRTLTFGERELPQELRPVVRALMARAVPEPL